MFAIEYLKSLPKYITRSVEGNGMGDASNSEMRRWLDKGSVLINGTRPKSSDLITFPITELVLFPKGKKKCTLVRD